MLCEAILAPVAANSCDAAQWSSFLTFIEIQAETLQAEWLEANGYAITSKQGRGGRQTPIAAVFFMVTGLVLSFSFKHI